MSDHLPLVSIVILNWNCRDFLPRCIESVSAQTYGAIELILMDNASTDDSLAWVEKNQPDVRVVRNDENLGFARAHNLGIGLTTGEYYMPLNPDVTLTPNFVTEMVQGLEMGEEIGALTGRVYFADESGEPTRQLYTTGHLLTKNRRPSNRGYKRTDSDQYDTGDYVFGVNGACPLLRRAMLEDVAMDGECFDETFFLYGDDYDLGWRAQLLGWKARYIPTAIAYHFGKGTGQYDSPFIAFQYALNHLIATYKNDLLARFLLNLPYILLYQILWQGYVLVTNPRRFVAHLRATLAFVRSLPETHRKRVSVQQRRRVTAAYMRSLETAMVLR